MAEQKKIRLTMDEQKNAIANAQAGGRSFADMVFGPLPEKAEELPRWADLSPKDQAVVIAGDFRKSLSCDLLPQMPARQCY